MTADPSPSAPAKIPSWREIVARYQKASTPAAVWQTLNTLVPYLGLWLLMWLCLDISWWLVAALAVLAGAFMVRAFIIFHDCGHGSFFASFKAFSYRLWDEQSHRLVGYGQLRVARAARTHAGNDQRTGTP